MPFNPVNIATLPPSVDRIGTFEIHLWSPPRSALTAEGLREATNFQGKQTPSLRLAPIFGLLAESKRWVPPGFPSSWFQPALSKDPLGPCNDLCFVRLAECNQNMSPGAPKRINGNKDKTKNTHQWLHECEFNISGLHLFFVCGEF